MVAGRRSRPGGVVVFDAQLHAAALRPADAEALRFFGVAGALLHGGGGVQPPSAAGLQADWVSTAAAARRMRRAGLKTWAALGVEPDRLPARGLAERLAALPELLSRPEVAAVGPAGLEGGGPREEEVLLAQAALAAELRRPLLVRAGRRRRGALLGQLLELLEGGGLPPERVLVIDPGAAALPLLRSRGHLALLPLSGPGGLEEAVRLVARLGPEGLVLGSGAGDGGGDLLAVPRAADRMAAAGLSVAVIRRVCLTNALGWLGRRIADLE